MLKKPKSIVRMYNDKDELVAEGECEILWDSSEKVDLILIQDGKGNPYFNGESKNKQRVK